MDNPTPLIIAAVVLIAASFFAGVYVGKRSEPQVDPLVLELLEAQVTAKDSAIARLQKQSIAILAIADSLAKSRDDYDVDKALPLVPMGRTDAELDSIRAIVISAW